MSSGGKVRAGINSASANRLTNPTTRNVMTGILLSPGPVSSLQVVRSLSKQFMSSVLKSKFLLAANRLESASFGSLVAVSNKRNIFVKKVPEEAAPLLQIKENQDLCTIDEYQLRFGLATPAVIDPKVQSSLVQMGLVPAPFFKQKEKRIKYEKPSWDLVPDP